MRSIKKTVISGVVYIIVSFNNVIITVSDQQGNVLAWSSSGAAGFVGAKKSTPYAAQVTASKVISKVLPYGLKMVSVVLRGPGPARESALRAIQAAKLNIVSLEDRTPVPHNGCRRRRRRRV